MAGDLAGWLLSVLGFGVVLLNRSIRNDRRLLWAVWFTLTVRHAAALFTVYVHPVPGVEGDALDFHRAAAELAANGRWHFAVGSSFYENLLAFFYRLFGPSHLLGQELGVLAYAVSCIVLVGLLDLLGVANGRAGLILLFGLLPAAVFIGSTTLREPFQILFFMLSVYWAIKPGPGGFVVSALAALAMGLFHNGLLVYALLLVAILGCWRLRRFGGGRFRGRQALAVLAGLAVLASIAVFAPPSVVGGSDTLMALRVGDALGYVRDYRHRAMTEQRGRADYGIPLDTSSPVTLAGSVALMYAHYLFAPFPWQVSNLKDAYGLLEAVLRAVLLVSAVLGWCRAVGARRQTFGLLLSLYFSLTLFWSLGTTNYGAALRHHLTTNWILVVLGGPVLFIRNTYRYGTREVTP